MTVATLIEQLRRSNPDAEVFLIVEDIGMEEVYSGITTKVVCAGEGAENGKCEIYAIA